jgi:hypothetical protein
MAIDLDDLERRAQLLIGIDLFCLPPSTVLELVRLARVGQQAEESALLALDDEGRRLSRGSE